MLCWMCKLELSHLAVPFTRCRLGAQFCANVERVPGIVLFANYPSSLPMSSFFSKQLAQVFLGMPSRTMQDCRCLYGKKMPYTTLKTSISICVRKKVLLSRVSLPNVLKTILVSILLALRHWWGGICGDWCF